jgi:4-hydroxybenzoate polyprenyltransferase
MDVPSGIGDALATLVIGIVLAVVLAALIVVFLPLVVFIFEALAVVVAAIALRRPWLVVASTLGPPPEERRWLVRGFLASRRAIREVASELRQGLPAEPRAFEQDSH